MSRQQRQSVTTRPWRLRKRVLPQHTDHAGVMWHGAYVAWLEEARVEALCAAGLSYAVMADEGIGEAGCVVADRLPPGAEARGCGRPRESLRGEEWCALALDDPLPAR